LLLELKRLEDCITASNTMASEVPEGYGDISDEDRKKAARFFDHAKSVAATGQYDYAIEMYVNGLTLNPEDLDNHKALREMSLKRKVSGGKDMGMFERRKFPTSTKDEKLNMLNAERQLAFDPGNTGFMLVFAQSALRAGFFKTTNWIADLLLKANAESAKPDYNKFIMLKDVYKGLGDFKQASDCCSAALELRPDDMELKGEMKNLAADHTMSKGRYITAKNFKESIRDMDAQQQLLDAEKDVRSEDMVLRRIRDAKAEWVANPNDSGKFSKFIDALKATESLEHENVALEQLDAMFKKTNQFKWRAKAGEIKLAQLIRMERSMRADVLANPTDPQRKKEYQQFVAEKTQSELDEFKLISENYPTDTNSRFEMAKRMFMLSQFQDVIPVLQQVRIDPKHRAPAGTLLARAFLEAGFADEAVDTLKTIIDEYPAKGDEKSKEMTYYFGRALESKGDIATALKQYSLVAQMEFKYKDVQDRVKRLRAEGGAK
jgi:tetratricopeptide (TPR) repeat protein